MLGAPLAIIPTVSWTSAATSPAQLSARLHAALVEDNHVAAKAYAGKSRRVRAGGAAFGKLILTWCCCAALLLDAWDAAPPATPLAAPTALAVLGGALVLAREARGESAIFHGEYSCENLC